MKARVTVTLKNGILDPQGKAIEGALKSLGVEGIASVRQGKVFDIEIAGSDKATAEAALKAAADRLLANTVIENYAIEVQGSGFSPSLGDRVMAEVSAELVYEVLKSVQDGISQIRGEIGEVKQRMAAAEISQNAIRQEIVGVHTELAGIHATLVRHEHRLDRIDRRLELIETPTLTA